MGLVRTIKAIDAIKVGERIRKDPGDLAALADSIGRLGLLHPIVIAPTDDLLAGWRRLEAAKLLGWTEVPVSVANDVADLRDALAVEQDENTERKSFTTSEADAMRRAIEALEKPAAKERQRAGGGDHRSGSAKLAEPAPRPRDLAARATGKSAETLRKAGKVIDVANDPATPEQVRVVAEQAVEDMDRTGKVDGPYQQTRDAIADHVAETMPSLVENEASRAAGKSIRKLVNDLKAVDPEVAGAGTRRTEHLDLHIEKVDQALAWLAAYRKAVVGLEIVKEASR